MLWQLPAVVAAFAVIPAVSILRRLQPPRSGGLHVQHDRDLLRIYVKGSNPRSHAWIEHQIRHEISMGADTPPDARYDVWRSVEVWEAMCKGMAFTRTRCIVQNGETELAIVEATGGRGKNASAYMGGRAHGNEFVEHAQLLVDGRPRDLSDFDIYRCSELRLTITSNVFKHGGGTTPEGRAEVLLCKKTTTWTFGKNARLLTQRLEFYSAITAKMLFLAMLPVRRHGAHNDWITTKAGCAPDWAPLDVADIGAVWPHSQSGHIRAWGPSGISAEVEITRGWDRPNRQSRVANKKIYNKMYFDFCGENTRINAGDVFEMAAIYRIDTSA
jgi:hypothetical protein